MDDASVELRNAVHHALSADDNDHNGTGAGGNNEMIHDDAQARHSSSDGDGSYISSLSGSLPSERSSALAAASRRRRNYRASNCGATAQREEDGGSGRSRRRWRLEAATRVEGAVSNYELALFDYHSHGETATSREIIPEEDRAFSSSADDSGFRVQQGEIVDLLVAVLTAVPRNLLRQQFDMSVKKVQNSREEEEYLASMEQSCFNAACVASDVIRKYSQMASVSTGNRQTLEVRHVNELIDAVVQISNTDPSVGAWFNLDPIIEILNSLSERGNLHRSINEREGNDASVEDLHQNLFSSLTSKECLRLVHTLIYRYLCEHEDGSNQPTGQFGYFISCLLEHFRAAIAEDAGCNSFEKRTVSLFDAWADGTDEHMLHRLNDQEARDIYDLIVRFHIVSLQTSLQLIKGTDSLLFNDITGCHNGIDEPTLESVIATMQDTICHMTITVATTEVMENLGLAHDPETPVAFHPLFISYARFTASLLQDTINLLRTTCETVQEVEEMSILADDLLFRLCRTGIGSSFLKATTDTGDEEEVLAVSLIRAVNTQCICGKAEFLLEIAASRARSANKGNVTCNEPLPKRPCVISNFANGQLQLAHLYRAVGSSLEARSETMADMILACLALSQFDQSDEDPDLAAAKCAACISSALMFNEDRLPTEDENGQALLNYLNPWHSLRVKPALRLATTEYSFTCEEEEGPREALLSYALSTPHILETKKPALFP